MFSQAAALFSRIRRTGLQIFDGLKHLNRDRARYRSIQFDMKAGKLCERTISLPDALHVYLYRKNRAKFVVVTLPVVTLFCIPVIGYLALPLIFLMPDKVLTGPLLTNEQRKLLQQRIDNERRTSFKAAVRGFIELLQETSPENFGLLRQTCTASGNSVNPSKAIEQALHFFEDDVLATRSLDKASLNDLAGSLSIKNPHFIPAFALRRMIRRKTEALQFLLRCLQSNIAGTSFNLENEKYMKALLHELLHNNRLECDEVEVAVTRLNYFSQIVQNSEVFANSDSRNSAFLYGLIYLALKQK